MIHLYMVPLANHLWQSTLFAVAVWLVILTLRKNRAAVRHSLWLAASVKFLVPFSLLATIGSQFRWETAPIPPSPVSTIVGTFGQPFSVTSTSPVPPRTIPVPPSSRFPTVILGVWVCGVAASLLGWSIRWRQVRQAVRSATPSNVNGPLRVMYGPELFEPGVFGIFKPVLLLPKGITHHLSPAQLEAVLAHEQSHVRRRDNLCMAIHMIVEALYWFHPLVWFIRARLIEEQELACDEEVLRLGTEPAVYAESLLKVCEFYVQTPLTCVSGVTGPDLKKRVGRIMRNQIGENLNRWRKLALAAGVMAALVLPVLAGMANMSPMRTQASQNRNRPAATPAWKVVSIRPCEPRPAGQRGGGKPIFSPGGINLACSTVESLIHLAYVLLWDGQGISPTWDVRGSTIEGGPSWISSDRYTVDATAAVVPSPTMMSGPMLQALLEDRFKLRVHWETREVPVYALRVAPGGPKLQPFTEGSCSLFPDVKSIMMLTLLGERLPQLAPGEKRCRHLATSAGPAVTLDADGITLDEFAGMLQLDLRVINKTGISGRFNFHLAYAHSTPPNDSGRAPELYPLIFTVVDQLGLKLEPSQGAYGEVLVVDSVEKPIEN